MNMVDRHCNSAAWQRHTGDILILPVGALEQHAEHLPLDTDICNAEYSAKFLAEHFDAALLPTLPIATSIEHSGFRGSFSLRPETLMQIVRDIAEEAESQHFRFLIIVSGHGGNFVLNPVSRDWNRRDRPLKILPIFPSEFANGVGLESSTVKIMDIHAGEIETSRYLAMGGKLLAPLPPRREAASMPVSWQRSDLNIFGIGHLNEAGHLGIPDSASEEKGKCLLDAMHRNIIAYLEDRLARLRRQSRYCGYGGLALRELCLHDLSELRKLVCDVGWNQLDAEWCFLLAQSPQTAIGFVHQGKVIASAALLAYPGGLAWINMVIVDSAWRGNRLAAKLIAELLERHASAGPIKLDATLDGEKVYAKLGFEPETTLLRFVRPAGSARMPPDTVRKLDSFGFDALRQIDQEAVHADRSALLLFLWGKGTGMAFQFGEKTFMLTRTGRCYRQLGPLYAPDAKSAIVPVEAAISSGEALLIDIPEEQHDFRQLLLQRGFVHLRSFRRMGLHTAGPENLEKCFAVAGPEFG